MAASSSKGIARVSLGQIGRQLKTLTVHGIRRLTEGFSEALHTPAEVRELAYGRRFDEPTGPGKLAKRHTVQNRLLRMLAVVVHNIPQRHAQANRVKPQLIHEFDDLQGLLLIIDAQINGEQVQGLIVELGKKLPSLASTVLLFDLIDIF